MGSSLSRATCDCCSRRSSTPAVVRSGGATPTRPGARGRGSVRRLGGLPTRSRAPLVAGGVPAGISGAEWREVQGEWYGR